METHFSLLLEYSITLPYTTLLFPLKQLVQHDLNPVYYFQKKIFTYHPLIAIHWMEVS